MIREIEITMECTGRRGGNKACRDAHRVGRSVHVIPNRGVEDIALVLPTYHYATEADARRAVADGWANGVDVVTDADLYRARANGEAYKLPSGWIDPSRSR